MNTPPMADNPRPISAQDIFPNCEREPAIDFIALAITEIAIIDVILTFTPSIALSPNTSAAILPPTPTSPFAIPFQDKPDILVIASAKVFMALAINIIDTPAFITPFPANTFNDLLMDLKDLVNIASMIPIAINDFVISPIFIFDRVSNAEESIAMAEAIAIKDPIFIPEVNACNDSLTEPRTSLNFVGFALDPLSPKIIPKSPPLKTSFIELTKFIIFLIATKAPPPTRPAKISPIDTDSPILENMDFIPSPILAKTSPMALPIPVKFSVNPAKPFSIPPNTSAMPVNIPVIPSRLNPLVIAVTKLPIAAVMLNITFSNPVTIPEVNILPTTLASAPKILTSILHMENKPLNVSLRFLAISSDIFISDVNL